MDSEYLIRRIGQGVEESQRLLSVLSATLERRFRQDQAVDDALEAVRQELVMLQHQINKLAKEK